MFCNENCESVVSPSRHYAGIETTDSCLGETLMLLPLHCNLFSLTEVFALGNFRTLWKSFQNRQTFFSSSSVFSGRTGAPVTHG